MRRKTRTINVGGVKIGSRFPIRIHSMTKTDTRNIKKSVNEIKLLEKKLLLVVKILLMMVEQRGLCPNLTEQAMNSAIRMVI